MLTFANLRIAFVSSSSLDVKTERPHQGRAPAGEAGARPAHAGDLGAGRPLLPEVLQDAEEQRQQEREVLQAVSLRHQRARERCLEEPGDPGRKNQE